MASPRRRQLANDDDPWKVYAFVSALMELFLSILLLLGAAIAFITSQLVKYFDLEPPCTYIGCSHTLSSNATENHAFDHGKVVFFYKLCPDCRAFWGYKNRYYEKYSRTEDDTEVSPLPEGDDTSSNYSSTSTSGVDVSHLDEDTYLSSDHQFVKSSSSTRSIRKCENSIKLKHVTRRASNVAGTASLVINEECVPLFSSRSVSACSSILNAEDHCELFPTSMDKCSRMQILCQERALQKETSKDDDDASSHSFEGVSNDKHYMLLEDEDEYEEVHQDPFLDSFEPVLGSEDLHPYMVLDDDDEDTSADGELHSEYAQPLLPCVADAILEGEQVFSTSLSAKQADVILGCHGPSGIMESAAASNYCEAIEDSKEPTRTDACESEHPYMLLEGSDEDTSKAPFFKGLNAESAQPLLNSGSDDDELEVPRTSNTAPTMMVLLDRHESSGIEQSAEVSIQTSPFEEQGQHQYILLEDDIEDSCEAPYLSDCAQPLLQHVDEGESKAPRLSLNFERVKLAALSQSYHRDSCIQGAGCLGPLSCDAAMADDHADSDDFTRMEDLNVPLVDLEIVECPTKSNNSNVQVSLLDMESKCTVLGDLLQVDSQSKILITEEASLISATPLLFQNQGHLNELEFTPLFWFTTNDANKAFVAAEVCSRQDDNANELEHTSIVKITSNASFETIFEEAVAQPDITFKSFHMKDKSDSAAEAMNAQQVNMKKYERVLNLVSKIADPDKEGIQVDDDREEGLDAMREALMAEREMLAALETELENERNAAAIATSEAMAMISRLQEEKSAMQLEVAQLQRMAEEKAEYDEQAMALLKEILFKRETEKHALEKEVELYKERLSAEKRDASMWSSTSLLSSCKTDEGKVFLSPKVHNSKLKNLPLLEEFCKLENTISPCLSKWQNMAQEEHTEQSAQFDKSPEPRSSKTFFVNDQVDACIAEGEGGSARPLIGRLDELYPTHRELRGTNRSIFATNDEESQFILDRLWVLEEELRELQGLDVQGAQRKSCEAQYWDCCSMGKKSVIDTCIDREAGVCADENGVGMFLPVHDVYEVHSAPSQQGGDTEGSALLENPGNLKSSSSDIIHAPTICSRSSQLITHTRKLSHPNETQSHCAMIASQAEPYLDSVHAPFLKTTEGGLDVIQQLAMRLQVLETDRELLREILESFRHRDAELKLLQEIAQQLRELRMVGFSSISRGGVLQDPMSATFGKTCPRAYKKRRYSSEPGQAELILLHQRSI